MATGPEENRNGQAPALGAVPVVNGRRYDTPPAPSLPRAGDATRATLTILTGLEAGRIVALPPRPFVMGRATDVDLPVDDPAVSGRHARITRSTESTFLLQDLGSRNGTFVGPRRVDTAVLTPGDPIQLGPSFILRFALTGSREEALQRKLFEASIFDTDTGVYNRRYLLSRLEVEVAFARRHARPLAVLMLDVDHFKDLNDRHGHVVGDVILSSVATRIRGVMRTEDVFARYGGDEFVVVARDTGPSDAIWLGERLRSAVEGLSLASSGTHLPVTISVGVAFLDQIDAGSDPRQLVSVADAQLYRAKAAGRNQVSAA